MKRFASLVIAAVVGGGVVWFLINRSQRSTPAYVDSSAQAPRFGAALGPAVPATPPPHPARAVANRKSTNDPTVTALKDNVLVNLGKVEDIGQKAADMLLTRGELVVLQKTDESLRTPEQKRRLLELERQRAAALGTLEEIEGFQDNPDEYARFFSALLRKAANLTDAQTNTFSGYMRSRAEAMIAGKLNAANEPTEVQQEEAWEERRDAFNEDTASGVAKLLAPGEAERIGFDSGFLELLERDFDKAK